MSRVLVFLFTVVLRRKLQSTTCLLVVPKPTYVLLCRVGNCLATCFCLFIWFSDFFLFHICRALSFSPPQWDTCWDKLRFESATWRYRVNSVLSLFPSERRLICTTNTLHVSTWVLMVHQAISKPVNQHLPALQIKRVALWRESVKGFAAGVFSRLMGWGLSKELIKVWSRKTE